MNFFLIIILKLRNSIVNYLKTIHAKQSLNNEKKNKARFSLTLDISN